jgi:hypothetical protein
VLFACWSSKGGSGTTVVTAAIGVLLARAAPPAALLADLAGDLPTALGLPRDGTGLGLGDWLAAGAEVPDDALARLELDAGPNLSVLPWQHTTSAEALSAARGEALAARLESDGRVVVADCGVAGHEAARVIAARATVSLLVVRPCYLALRRALEVDLRPAGIVLISEAERSLGRADVEDVIGAPVLAEVPVEAKIARAVDAGLLAGRLPRSLERALHPVLGTARPLGGAAAGGGAR